MVSTKFQKVTLTNGEQFFSLYCSEESLENRRDEIFMWADKLAKRLHWEAYDTTFSPASRVEALKQPYALFEHRFPKNIE